MGEVITSMHRNGEVQTRKVNAMASTPSLNASVLPLSPTPGSFGRRSVLAGIGWLPQSVLVDVPN
jgi:hypothetical protein